MATRSTGGVGLAHVTVVPTNFEPDADAESADERRTDRDRPRNLPRARTSERLTDGETTSRGR